MRTPPPAWAAPCPTCGAGSRSPCRLPSTGEALPRSKTHNRRVVVYRRDVLARRGNGGDVKEIPE